MLVAHCVANGRVELPLDSPGGKKECDGSQDSREDCFGRMSWCMCRRAGCGLLEAGVYWEGA